MVWVLQTPNFCEWRGHSYLEHFQIPMKEMEKLKRENDEDKIILKLHSSNTRDKDWEGRGPQWDKHWRLLVWWWPLVFGLRTSVKAGSLYGAQLCDAATRLAVRHAMKIEFSSIFAVTARNDAAGYIAVHTKCSQIAARAMQQVALPHRIVEQHIVN